MPKLPERKVGIVACSGEEIAEGTVSRLAALKVLHEYRRGETVTICLPLFLAGGDGDRAFAKVNPTITIDGCDLKCAFHGTSKYSNKPAGSIVVSELAAEHGITGIQGCRCLNEAGKKAVDITAEKLAQLVDKVLGREGRPLELVGDEEPASEPEAVGGCSCGSGIPVKHLTIGGNTVEVIALPLIFDKLREDKVPPADVSAKLLETVKVYNYVTPELENEWRMALVNAFEDECRKKGDL